jgi:hypothetical protein
MNSRSQKDQVLDHLLTGASITAIDALNKFNAFRLSSIIHRLRGEHWDIKTEMVNDPHTDKIYAKYRLQNTPNIKV